MENKTLQLVYLETPDHKRQRAINAANVEGVLRELYLLLEDYAPVWYTEEHHSRALNALLDRKSN
jgi:hypothetical protein